MKALFIILISPVFLPVIIIFSSHLFMGGTTLEESLTLVPAWVKVVSVLSFVFYIPVFEWIRDDVLGGI